MRFYVNSRQGTQSMSLPRKNWTRDELILAFNLYCQTPFGRIHTRNPGIISLAERIGRSPSAVSWKLANFARLDPTLAKRDIKGASHGSKEEEAVWREFESDWDKLAFESERLRLGEAGFDAMEASATFPEGATREALVKLRVNQGFFRRAVLNAYDSRCCISGISVPALLCASHIVPWAADLRNRTNPSNGLCLNALHDRAFDRGLITISCDLVIIVSPKIGTYANDSLKIMLLDYADRRIRLPKHFTPDKQFLQYHNEHIFQA
jgi:putative restriction endonuclease